MSNEKRIARQKRFVQRLAEENRTFYGTTDGAASLRAFGLTLAHRWIYLFELVQNAIDANATSISIQVTEDGDGLAFQHDGSAKLSEADVEGLSKLFRSTKGASSVGFMGIGFKSVFARFKNAGVSGSDWTFRYEVEHVVGKKYGDVQPNRLGAVLPIWDPDVPAPDSGFTTRFQLSNLVDPSSELHLDLERFLPPEDRTPLAILAYSGVRRLELDGHGWELGTYHEERSKSWEATALGRDEDLLWQLFPVKFTPSPKAVARFLEHREIQPSPEEEEHVYAEAARAREVLGVMPLDDRGTPVPPIRGRVYATLPTDETLPIGLHVHADWLLDSSRTGLRDLSEDPWQLEVTDHIADVVESFLRWTASECTNRAAATAAFSALALPTSDSARHLDAVLAQKRWLERLRAGLERIEFLPAWAGADGELRFVDPAASTIPPEPLARVLEGEPQLLPEVLLGDKVVLRGVIGPSAWSLLSALDLVPGLDPNELVQRWSSGLEHWWDDLPEERNLRRDLLFLLWGAIAELCEEPDSVYLKLRCLRAVGGTWHPVSDTRYFKEALPSEKELGGREVRGLIDDFLPDLEKCLPGSWVPALRSLTTKATETAPYSRAQEWLNTHAEAWDLPDAIRAAISSMEHDPSPDWDVLIPLGLWAMGRGLRSDLLTHVLVENRGGRTGVPIAEALIADPYVERGGGRRGLFPTMRPIVPDYLDGTPEGQGRHEWRTFFEKAGARGTLSVQLLETQAPQGEVSQVAKFLDVEPSEVRESNVEGYKLHDFVISPPLPSPDAPTDVRAALADWLEDGHRALRAKGRRRAKFHYHRARELTGRRLSDWVVKLGEIAWVPSSDRDLRRPSEVLPATDPSRDDSPFARLSDQLITALELEGLSFGTAIPEAPALRRLISLGSTMDNETLAGLLEELQTTAQSEEDGALFEQAVAGLTVPDQEGNRTPISRVVSRAGGRARGTLGGWILPLTSISDPLKSELSRTDLPYEIPASTTGYQALEYLRDVWERARAGESRLANEVRDVLPGAYSYCLEDMSTDEALADRWAGCLDEAMVFADREWILLAQSRDGIYLDDLPDRRFLPSDTGLTTVTAGHLGNTSEQQIATAKALGLQLLSSAVSIKWSEGEGLDASSWLPRFDLIFDLLRSVRGREGDTAFEDSAGQDLQVARVGRLQAIVTSPDGGAERVAVNARLQGATLAVSGSPVEFAADAAKQLLSAFSFSQRGDLAADLTALLTTIDSPTEFGLAARKFARSFIPGFELPPEFQKETGRTDHPEHEDDSDLEEEKHKRPPHGIDADRPNEEETQGGTDDTSITGGSYRRDRALAQQKALADRLKAALKGELIPDEDEHADPGDEGSPDDSGTEGLGDEVYREAVMKYERNCGRRPELGAPGQMGWDIRSFDPATGAERFIEVKGKGLPWDRDEVVAISRPQARSAFQALQEESAWFLYVVERTANGNFQVLPIENPMRLANHWILAANAWRMVASDPREISLRRDDESESQE